MVEDAPARAERIVDARGHRCPTPTLRLRRALERAEPDGAVLVLLADDADGAASTCPHFAAEAGHAVLDRTRDGAGPALQRAEGRFGGRRGP